MDHHDSSPAMTHQLKLAKYTPGHSCHLALQEDLNPESRQHTNSYGGSKTLFKVGGCSSVTRDWGWTTPGDTSSVGDAKMTVYLKNCAFLCKIWEGVC